MNAPLHRPVLLADFLSAAAPLPGEKWIDATFGRGGHSRALLQAGVQLLALDRDAEAQSAAAEILASTPDRFAFQRANFEDLLVTSELHGWQRVDGILADLGVSSPQFDTGERGFSFRHEGPLDMRMDQRQALTAGEVINTASEAELARCFYEYGEERESRRIARAIVRHRPFTTTTQLADVVAQTIPQRRAAGVHPATKVFQALRLLVNREPEAVSAFLPQAARLLAPGGRLAVISFHSGEDRPVKQFLQRHSSEHLDLPGAPYPVDNPERYFSRVVRRLPSAEETEVNPRARSARLRIAVRNSHPVRSFTNSSP